MDQYYENFRVRLHAEYMGSDLCITICGGDSPHIGSVAIAEPRESLNRGWATIRNCFHIQFFRA